MLTQERVKELFDYQEDGQLIWKIKRGGKAQAGAVAGAMTSNGYLFIRMKQKSTMAHRIVFLWHHGYLPEQDIDHIDGNRTNNRIENLREATRSQNNGNSKIARNNTSGYKGVQWCKTTKKWRSVIWINNKRKCLGRYDDIENAAKAYHEAAIVYFGVYAKTAFVQNGKTI